MQHKVTSHSHIIQAEQALLVVIDVQQRLLSAMPDDVSVDMIKQVSVMLKMANSLTIPVLATEQYPQGLGATEATLAQYISTPILAKTCFSCADLPEFMTQLKASQKQQIILTGMETHICVLQTALALQTQGFQVFVVENAVSSRTVQNQHNALQRLRQADVIITNTESVLFECLADAKHPEFRSLSKLIV